MGALIWRDLMVVSRSPALWLSAAVYTTGLAFCVLVWSDGVPVVGAPAAWQQFSTAERLLLAVLLPWTAARCGVSSRHEMVMTGLVTASHPRVLVLARGAALSTALIAVALAALPVVTLMGQITVVRAEAVALNVVPTTALAVFIASSTVASAVVLETPVRTWAATTAMSLTVIASIPSAAAPAPLWVAAGAAAMAIGCAQASKLTYVAEDAA